MTRLYENFLSMIHDKDSTSIGSEQFGLTCANEACDVRINRGDPVWRISGNRSDGWVIRHGEVHPECGEAMPFYGLTDRIRMQREAYERRTARRAAREAARA